MAEIGLRKLSLRNFKGLREFTLELPTKPFNDASIYGDNATGKTTLADAWFWLLYGKNSQDQVDFEIKTLDEHGQPIHGLEHEVEGVLEIDGKLTVLRKVYAEKWTKRRGAANKEFTGHTTDYYIDGVPMQKKEYDARTSIVDEKLLKLLSNVRHFNEVLHWQDRRKILLEVCGDISDEEVIAKNSDLADLPGILDGRPFDDHRAMVLAHRTKINKELQEIPLRIDEANRGLPKSEESCAIVTAALDGFKSAQQAKQREFITLKEGGSIAEKTKTLQGIESKLIELERAHWLVQADAKQATVVEMNKVREEIEQHKSLATKKQGHIDANDAEIAELEKQMATWREEWHVVNAEGFVYAESDTCPTCGQSLPTEQVETAREKALANFNRQKAERLEAIQQRGKEAHAKCESLVAENAHISQGIESAASEQNTLEARASDLHGKLEAAKQLETDYTKLPEHITMTKEKATLEQAIAELRLGCADALDALSEEIARYNSLISEKVTILAQLDQRGAGLQRIEELKAQEKTLAAAYERLERELYLTDQFVRSKVQFLERQINSCFQFAHFKMFNELINGGIEECCETLYQGVPYNSALNNGARLNVGIDIINTLSEHYDSTVPIWLDNAEAVSQIIESRGQQIRLHVSEPDKMLRVELAKQEVAA